MAPSPPVLVPDRIYQRKADNDRETKRWHDVAKVGSGGVLVGFGGLVLAGSGGVLVGSGGLVLVGSGGVLVRSTFREGSIYSLYSLQREYRAPILPILPLKEAL